MAYSLPLLIHISAGAVGILSGAAALAFRKGERRHRAAGNVFFVSMLIMSGFAAFLAVEAQQRESVAAGIITFYLVATAWAAVMRKEGTVGLFEPAAFLVAAGAAAMAVIFGQMAAGSPDGKLDGYPPMFYYYIASVPALAALLDLSVLLRGGIAGRQRIARHLWRMCFALFIAAGSFFLGQQEIFPETLRGSAVLAVPALAPLVFLLFWLIVAAFTRRFRSDPGGTAA